MAWNINKIADGLGANVVGQVPDAGGGAFGAARMARIGRSITGKEAGGESSPVESLLIQGLDSGPATPMTADDWDEVEREGQRLIAERKAQRAR